MTWSYEQVTNNIWDSRLDADYRARYFQEKASRFNRRHTWLSGAVTLLSSAAVVALLVRLSNSSFFPWGPEVCALTVAVLGGTMMHGRYFERAVLSASLSRRWAEIHVDADVLWSRLGTVTEDEAREAWAALESKASQLGEEAAVQIPFDRELAEKVHDEMLVAEGLADAA